MALCYGFEREDSMVEGETPGVTLLSKNESSVMIKGEKHKGILFKLSLCHFFIPPPYRPPEAIARRNSLFRVILGKQWFLILEICPAQRNSDFICMALMLVTFAWSRTSTLVTKSLQWMLRMVKTPKESLVVTIITKMSILDCVLPSQLGLLHRMYLCRGVRPHRHQWVSCLWH